MARSLELHWDHDVGTKQLLATLPGSWVFSDGGLLSPKNPNPDGVTGAYYILNDFVISGMGMWVNPVPGLSNNDSEMDALTRALERIVESPKMVNGPLTICIDSGVTFQRLVKAYLKEPWNRESADEVIADRFESVLEQVDIARLILVSGHPPKREVERVVKKEHRWFEWNAKRGRYWHYYNVLCDDQCNMKKERWQCQQSI